MHHAPRPLGRVVILLVSVAALALPAAAAEKPRLRVDDYEINAELLPKTHKLTAQARVKFTALDDINIATFELHNALRPTRVDRCQRAHRSPSSASARIRRAHLLAQRLDQGPAPTLDLRI